MKGNIAACWAFTRAEEGGFSDDRNDPGNWTGGAVGRGFLRGTKYGISASAYPALDVANLTEEFAEMLFRRDYWTPLCCDGLAPGVDLLAADFAFTSGAGTSARCLQEAVGVMEDGRIGPITLAAVARVPAEDLIKRLEHAHEEHYEANRNFARYGKVWIGRSTKALAVALEMAEIA